MGQEWVSAHSPLPMSLACRRKRCPAHHKDLSLLTNETMVEMRSRFFMGSILVRAQSLINTRDQLARDLAVHCANEMSHLGTFLPALFEEFKNDIPTGRTGYMEVPGN